MKDQVQKLRVFIADKSSYTRLVLEDILGSESDITIAGMAADGDELLQQLKVVQPDVVIVDYKLPKNSRLFTLKRVFSEAPAPILLLIEKEKLTLDLIKEATEVGVYGIVLKPGPEMRPNYRNVGDELIQKVRAVRESEYWDVERRIQLLEQDVLVPEQHVHRKTAAADTVIVIGASTGGTQAIESIVRQLTEDLKATVLVAVHLPERFTKTFSKRLQELTPLKVMEGKSGLPLKPGKIIVAPGGRNMVVEAHLGNPYNLMIGFTDEPAVTFDQPSVDLLMKSVAKTQVKHVIGIILTGMGKDGTVGASLIQERGGIIIAQNEESSAIFGMAKSAIESGYINKVLPLSDIPHFINGFMAQQHEVSATDSIT
ncbi:chemotaxis protein CheB [Pontibacter ruber]|uniref:protein-glutamate methylesterase n=1 Tax=Pontibacter ruber TaxID=1343895 RepID=A0ABW5CRP8_9BACT|nr:chemotaxis protein CheB [Pontibacter ruber]